MQQSAASSSADGELARRQSNSTNTLAATSLCASQPPGSGGDGGNDGGGGGNHAKPLYDLGALQQQEVVLTLASFAVTKLAYVRVTKAFREAYQRQTGLDVRFRLTFAASGVQARAVIDGLPADLVALALPLDLDKIVAAGLTAPDWRSRHPCNATVCETTVAFVVRQGNPKDIRTWDDLTRPDIQIVLANPKTAGVARWIFLALWGAKMKKGSVTALDYVTRVFENVVVQPRDAREASDVFYKQKVGDVLLTYENEVILTNEVYGDKALPYLVPSYNIRIECPLALVDKVVEARGPEVMQAAVEFCRYLFTPAAQLEFAKLGFRVNPQTCKEVASQQTGLPAAQLWQVDRELGGWASAQVRFFDAGAILDEIQMSVGRKRAEERNAANNRR
ncbi:Sulfate-binding protein [Tetrabaena socialis]|uniref:Sulfate-binding protein n=1 Tax=Tetrabaena socialis TaxID=47790 RepID=A0A2J7ZYU4_9CHLO|nr:Sulfate-binding protein [Tetrabaena socialis]|eukprot:PNH05418.1 Sulfate-binding protein [Tetrabaena socialis]